jgi:hypothetical protein
MQIKKITFESHPNSYELTIKNQKMIVATDFGPRIMHLSINDHSNILFRDSEGKYRNGNWQIYGGHRLWLSPENLRNLTPNNEKCEIDIKENSFTVKKLDKKTQFEKAITITEKNNHFMVTHTIINKSEYLQSGALWALTCLKPAGTIFIPWATPGSFKMSKIIYWNEWIGQTTNVNSAQFSRNNDYFFININGEMSKVGSAAYDGYVGITTDTYTFIKKFNRQATNDYPDDNCAVECYTCEDFVELETLSPNMAFLPGICYSHTEKWILLDKKIDLDKKDEIKKVCLATK